MSPEEERIVGGWGGERGRKEAASFPPCSPSPPGISRVGKEQGGPASPCPATYMLWSSGNSLPVSGQLLVSSFLGQGQASFLRAVSRVQDRQKRERKRVSHMPLHLGGPQASQPCFGLSSLLPPTRHRSPGGCQLKTSGRETGEELRAGGAQGPCRGLGVEGPPGRQGSEERRPVRGEKSGRGRERSSRFRGERGKRERE